LSAHVVSKLVRHAGAWVLKVAQSALELFQAIREKNFKLAVASSP
jgi:phosphoserine phosphatase